MIAALSAAFGGAGVKIVESIIKRQKRTVDTTSQIRQELRSEAESLRKENNQLLEELDEWKRRYFEILQELNNMKLELRRIRMQLGIPEGDKNATNETPSS